MHPPTIERPVIVRQGATVELCVFVRQGQAARVGAVADVTRERSVMRGSRIQRDRVLKRMTATVAEYGFPRAYARAADQIGGVDVATFFLLAQPGARLLLAACHPDVLSSEAMGFVRGG